ncbi:MAG: MBL fold metallo-hydrolase [Verrucomicrobiota bacterium]|nr:MBL fold metallo-hydrolase [Verrucomicrobiota bacterium]
MKFINLTRHTEIGANSYCLEAAGKCVILDSGMHPKERGENALPDFRALDDRSVDAILVSHAHQDHFGTLPILMRRVPKVPVFMTEATGEMGDVLLHNSVNVMTRQREELGLASYPLFTHREADRAADRWQFCRFRQQYDTAGERVGYDAPLTFELVDAGHVLGSAGILLRAEGRTIFYTGDVNFDEQTLMQPASFPENGVDVLIMECTRGDAPASPDWSRASEEKRFASAIAETFRRGGCVLAPVFALGKTQEALAMLWKFRREKWLDDFPIYIGGLSSKMTEIYDRRSTESRRQWPRLQLLKEVAPFVLNGQTIGEAPARPGRVYALSSGMMTAKTLSNTFARRVVENPAHSILFVGYADPASPGGILRATKTGDAISLDPELPPQMLRCHVEAFQFSAHASRESLVAYAQKLAPQKIVLVHGDPPAVAWMRGQLAAQLPRAEIIVPAPGEEIDL